MGSGRNCAVSMVKRLPIVLPALDVDEDLEEIDLGEVARPIRERHEDLAPLTLPLGYCFFDDRGADAMALADQGNRRGWDSNHRRVLKTKNLRDFGFRRTRQIRSKTEVEARIEHAAPYTRGIWHYDCGGPYGMPRTAKVFMTNRSQAVRLPKEYQFSTDEVFIRKEGDEVILSPRPRDWNAYLESAPVASDAFMSEVEDLPVEESEH